MGIMALTTPPVVAGGGGGVMNSTISTPGSSSSRRRQPAYCSGVAEASISTGLCVLAAAGSRAARALSVWGANWARVRPACSSASAAVTPGPPALVSTATLRPWGSGHQARARAHWNISSVVLARSTPARAKAASKAASAPASAPVCEAAARRPASKRPTFSATSGFRRAAWRAFSTNCAPFCTPSRYRVITRVWVSSATDWRKSLSERSAWLPRLSRWDRPMPCPRTQSMTAAQMAPEWERKAISPVGGGGG